MLKRLVSLLVLSTAPSSVDAFVAPFRVANNVASTTAINDVSSVPTDDGSGLSYSERSRPYRRDVFNYDDWVRHRSSDRFAGRLGN